jgi:hypothetical protein
VSARAWQELIEKHRGRPVLLDSNLLVVVFVKPVPSLLGR